MNELVDQLHARYKTDAQHIITKLEIEFLTRLVALTHGQEAFAKLRDEYMERRLTEILSSDDVRPSLDERVSKLERNVRSIIEAVGQ